jgi:DNA-binding NtrC family response regulator
MAKVMVLDDMLDAVILIKRVLEGVGHEVFGFTDEGEALKHIKKNRVDLAILDIKLKKMTGVEVLAEIRNLAPSTRVIMLTGYPTVDTTRESLELGASEYCVKPIDNEVLEKKVSQVLKNA